MCAIAISVLNTTPTFACTPKLNPPSVKIPDIKIIDDETISNAAKEAAKKWVENNVLKVPNITNAYYMHKETRCWSYGFVYVKWSPIENATRYDIKITKSDGTKKVYTTTCNMFCMSNWLDDFVTNGMDGVTVKVKAYGDNDKFSLWSEEYTITNIQNTNSVNNTNITLPY